MGHSATNVTMEENQERTRPRNVYGPFVDVASNKSQVYKTRGLDLNLAFSVELVVNPPETLSQSAI